jgi:MFS transporter, FHS family, glucose/mannose:H+ symporter
LLARGHFTALYLVAAAAWLAVIPTGLGISGRLPVGGAPWRSPGALVGVFVCGFLLYVAIENGIGGWMTTHLVASGLDLRAAATFTSGFWIALVAGRLLITLVPPAVSEAKIVLAGSALAASALLCGAFAPLAPYAYLAAGFAMAPIFPTAVVWLARLRPGDARATSWVYPATAIGGVVGPGAIGVVIAGAGVGWAPAVLGSVAAVMVAAFWLAARRSRA